MKQLLLSFSIILFSISSLFSQDKPFQIINKPRALYANKNCSLCVQGTVTLRVEFLHNGKIGKISTVSGLPCSLSESSIEAAKKIEFEPAKKNGEPATITKQIQYSFSIYDDTESSIDEKAEAIIQKAVEKLGGEKYLQVKSIVSTGNYTVFRGGTADLPSSFIDVISFPAKERTEFKQGGNKTIQTNSGENGWIYDAGTQTLREQNPAEIANFKQSRRTSLDNLLRGLWRDENATLTYIGKRPATLGKRNEVIKLTFADNFKVEFEFDAVSGMPMKSVFEGKDADGADAKEEEHYAQFVEVQAIYAPFIVDRYIAGKQQSRINYSKIEFNKNVPESVFTKPSNVKSLKKDLKL